MSYNKVGFLSGQTLKASDLNHMEDGIIEALPLSGGTMTGALMLNSTPTSDLHAATKKYVDDSIQNISLTPGEKGDDGISCTHSWDGTTLTVTSVSGTSSANLKGDKGDDGYAPVKGTDYWTEADKQGIVNEVAEQINIVQYVPQELTDEQQAQVRANISAQQKLTGSIGQLVGFDADGNAVANASIDTTLAISGAAADAKAVGDALSQKQAAGDYALKSDISSLGDLATKDIITKTDLALEVQILLDKADTALQTYTETDPTVPAWAKTSTKPSYSASEVGADAIGTAASAVSAHNTAVESHNDIRLLIEGLTTRLNALADSDDTTLDQMSEIVAYIKSNKNLIDSITTNKINVSDIINNLTTNVTNKPLSAAQGVALKALIDAIVIPTKVSELTNDKGYLTEHQSLAEYAKTADLGDLAVKNSLTASEVGALPISGGTMTGEIKIGQGDGNGIQLGTNGRINATVGSNTAATMFGVSNGIYYLGHSGFSTTIRGSKTRPTYNGNNMALYSDVTSVSSEVQNKMPNVAVTTSDNGKFLRVVNGAWAASSIPNAEEATF